MPATAVRQGQRTGLSSGPWKGVQDDPDPFNDDPTRLQDALNGYIPDAEGGSGWFQRPTFQLRNGSGQLGTRGQGMYHYVGLDGTEYNFFVASGKLYRADGNYTSTDVTPVGVSITSSATARVYVGQLAGSLIVNDETNRPWVGTDLASTPITGTYIDIDGVSGSWTARGQPTIYGGAVYFIALTTPTGSSVNAGVGIVWSEPNQPTVGYTQSGYTDFWNLVQMGTAPLFALAGTNTRLLYFREQSIGAVSGFPGSNFATTASHDAVAFNIGTRASAALALFGDTVFFVDVLGRPWMLRPGEKPTAIWKQLRTRVLSNGTSAAYPQVTARMAVSAIDPNLNLWVVAPWSPNPSAGSPNPPNTLYIFDADTGNYEGRWQLQTNGIGVNAIGIQRDTVGQWALTVLGSATGTSTDGGYIWTQYTVANEPGWALDGNTAYTISVTSMRLGAATNLVYNADFGQAVTMSASSATVKVTTPYQSAVTESTGSTPATSQDGTNRIVWGMDVTAARNIALTITKVADTAQWGIERIVVEAIPCLAGVEDA